tara:strand:+ start:161 stop:454 length:294 start_codon:yes stop_codon:yes gene_type:complete
MNQEDFIQLIASKIEDIRNLTVEHGYEDTAMYCLVYGVMDMSSINEDGGVDMKTVFAIRADDGSELEDLKELIDQFYNHRNDNPFTNLFNFDDLPEN